MNKLAYLLIGIAYALGIITGIIIDKDYYIRGKVKQKGGRGNIQDITSNLNLNKKKRRQKNGSKKK